VSDFLAAFFPEFGTKTISLRIFCDTQFR